VGVSNPPPSDGEGGPAASGVAKDTAGKGDGWMEGGGPWGRCDRWSDRDNPVGESKASTSPRPLGTIFRDRSLNETSEGGGSDFPLFLVPPNLKMF